MLNDPTLEERVAALEARKDVSLDDLPMAALQRRLEQRWQPDASQLLQPNTVTRDAMAQKLDYGKAVVTFPGGGSESSTLTVSHALGVIPLGVVAITENYSFWSIAQTGSFTDGTFDVRVRTVDGTTPVATTPKTLYWIAFA